VAGCQSEPRAILSVSATRIAHAGGPAPREVEASLWPATNAIPGVGSETFG